MILDETTCAYENDDMYLVLPKEKPYVADDSFVIQNPPGFWPATGDSFSSENTRLITKEEIRSILYDLDIGHKHFSQTDKTKIA